MPDYLQRESNKITIANFYEGYGLKKYNFEPPYQRRSLWTEEKKSFLIDSIIKNFPIPPIFLHQKIDDTTGKTTYDVIDGKQRLTAIIEFIENVIPVADESGDEFGGESIAGLFFSDFEEQDLSVYKSRFWRYVIPVEYVDTGEQEVIDSIFDRLNRNGEPLNGQELRNANFYGTPLLNLINEIAKEQFWRERLKPLDHTRMEEIEFLSELVFLILEKHELHANQGQIDSLYEKYASNINYDELKDQFVTISTFMESLGLDYKARRIGGVSHLYGIFAFSYKYSSKGILPENTTSCLNEFYDRWQEKDYSNRDVMQYKESMSSRTKDRSQRQKRTKSLMEFCSGENPEN